MSLETLNPLARIRNARNGAAYRALLSLREWQRLESDAEREVSYAATRFVNLPLHASAARRADVIASMNEARVDLNQVRNARRNAEHRLQAAAKLSPLVAVWKGR